MVHIAQIYQCFRQKRRQM